MSKTTITINFGNEDDKEDWLATFLDGGGDQCFDELPPYSWNKDTITYATQGGLKNG
jgi:hypothetical protein